MIKFFTVLLVSVLVGRVALAQEDSSILVTYYHYPPEIRVENGVPRGKYIDEWNAIAAAAGLKVKWLPSTIDQEAAMLDDARRAICTTGRMPTAERSKRWDFLPFLFDFVPGDVLLTRRDNAEAIKALKHIRVLVQNPNFRGALLESGIYGSEVDVFLLSQPDWILRTGKTDFQLMNMVLAGRADYTIVPEMQLNEALKVMPMASSLVPIRNFGTHPSYPIYIACSKAVAPEVFEALKNSMAQLGYKPGAIPK